MTAVRDAGSRLSRHGPAGRAEFKRVLLDSLIASAVLDLEVRRSRHQRLRARSAERRLDELRRERRELDVGRVTRHPWRWLRSAAVGYVVSVLWLAGVVALGVEVGVHGVHTHLSLAGDLAMLLLSLLWFLLAVARVPLSEPEAEEPSSAAPHV